MQTEDKSFVFERVVSCLMVLGVVLFLSPQHVLDAVVVLGHAHFALSYFYQSKAGKIRLIYLLPYAVVLGISFYLRYEYEAFFLIFVATFFLFHNFFDEFKLRSEKPSAEYLVLIFILVATLSGWTADFFIGSHVTKILIYISFAVGGILLGAKAVLGRVEINWRCSYLHFLLLMMGIFLTMEFTGHRPDARESFGAVILIHYMAWYIRLGMRFKQQGVAVFNTYIKRVLIANFIFMAGYYVVVIAMERQGILYEVIYAPFGFYVWTLMHLLTTFRLSDYKSAFNLSSKISRVGA
jgi:hypothetical protein